MKKPTLTEPQKEALLQIGKPNSPVEVVKRSALEDLLSLRLIQKTGKKQINLTDLGEAMYNELTGNKDDPWAD